MPTFFSNPMEVIILSQKAEAKNSYLLSLIGRNLSCFSSWTHITKYGKNVSQEGAPSGNSCTLTVMTICRTR